MNGLLSEINSGGEGVLFLPCSVVLAVLTLLSMICLKMLYGGQTSDYQHLGGIPSFHSNPHQSSELVGPCFSCHVLVVGSCV